MPQGVSSYSNKYPRLFDKLILLEITDTVNNKFDYLYFIAHEHRNIGKSRIIVSHKIGWTHTLSITHVEQQLNLAGYSTPA